MNREYDKVPEDLETDRVMPPVSELPQFISKVRHPRRSRSVSIGPQSEADAYEALAYRDKVRRDSRSSGSGSAAQGPVAAAHDAPLQIQSDDAVRARHHAGEVDDEAEFTLVDMPSSSSLAAPPIERTPSQERRENEKEKRELFAKVVKPRVRYDVEVVTKLIVYTGSCLSQRTPYLELTRGYRYCLDRHRMGSDPFRVYRPWNEY